MIEKEFVATGKLRYALVDLPLAMHKLAFKAAETAACAREQGRFWEMHSRLFANQRQLEPWTAHAEAVGLDMGQFEECLESGRFADEIRSDMTLAGRLGITGTPSFVVAVTDPENPDQVKGLSFIRGAQPYPTFKAQIERALNDVSP